MKPILISDALLVEDTNHGRVDWHEIAALVARGCPPRRALEIAR